jgi:16S rRNA (cytosine1402-N4)-methyltransferase
MGALQAMLKQTAEILKPGGRLVVISYHSLEDRLVKNYMKTGNFEGEQVKDFYGNVIAPLKQLTRKPITPSDAELKSNPRSRSAKLRIAQKIEP